VHIPARTEPRHLKECPAAYVVRCACDPGPDGSGGDTVVDHIRLFPLRDGVRLYASIARAHQVLGNSQAALQTCAEGLQLDPGDAEL
jgi:hypothetical protein